MRVRKKKLFKEFLSLYEEGINLNRLAKYLGISYPTILRWRDRIKKKGKYEKSD